MNRDEIIDWLHALAEQYHGDDTCNKVYLDGQWMYVDSVCEYAWEQLDKDDCIERYGAIE